jgi:hypothetical protein
VPAPGSGDDLVGVGGPHEELFAWRVLSDISYSEQGREYLRRLVGDGQSLDTELLLDPQGLQ